MTEEISSERQLYEPTRRFLNLAFPGLLRARAAGAQPQVFPDVVATRSTASGGRWTQPDLACVVVSRGEFLPYLGAELHTFEVKTAAGLDETAAHEAYAHGRFGQFAWLVFQAVGRVALAEAVWSRVESQAQSLGVGVICFADPDSSQDWKVVSWPRQTGTNLAVADRFVSERFSAEAKERIAHQLAAYGWASK